MDTQEVLATALEELELNGWCKHTLKDYLGKHCAVGAVLEVTEGSMEWHPDHDTMPALQALCKAVPIEISSEDVYDPMRVIAEYNNMHCKSIDDVRDWFIRAKEFC